MSTGDPYCPGCGSMHPGVHMSTCPAQRAPIVDLVAGFAQQLQPTAYERAQQALRDRVAALEFEVARLKAWSRPPDAMCMECGTGYVNPEHLANHVCCIRAASESPATAYPPIPDEPTV